MQGSEKKEGPGPSFLYPKNNRLRAHLRLMAECANLDPQWLAECLERTADLPMPRLRECINCRSLIPISDYGLDSRDTPERLCTPCRAEIPVREKARKGTCPSLLGAEVGMPVSFSTGLRS
jgi:hypothetical protein